MTENVSFLALDLGAESGRTILGQLDGDRLTIEEIYRFANGGVRVGDSLLWDMLGLWREIKNGLTLAAQKSKGGLLGLGMDAWGVDFGLLAADDTLAGNPYHYRDHRTDGMMEVAFRKVPKAEIYEQTGIQFMQINSLYQLLAMAEAGSPALEVARTFLNIPDLFNFWLSGRKASEFTIASTTQCYNPRTGDWATDLLAKLGVPTHIFGEITQPGTVLEKLRPDIAEETGCPQIPVIASAGHDTGAAVAAVPAENPNYIYLSSGTWSLMGIEAKEPIITRDSLAAGMTNEGGVEGTFRLLKNIMGLWLVQECRRQWAREGAEQSYDELTQLAAEAPPFGPLIAVDDSQFLAPDNMPFQIQTFCQWTGQAVPQTKGEILRCALESLALEYRRVAEQLDALMGKRLPVIHIIGGGAKNRLLDQFAADATGRVVVTGPVEATAIGNVLVQAMAVGRVASLAEGRAIVKESFEVETFEPGDTAAWDEAYERYRSLKRGKV